MSRSLWSITTAAFGASVVLAAACGSDGAADVSTTTTAEAGTDSGTTTGTDASGGGDRDVSSPKTDAGSDVDASLQCATDLTPCGTTCVDLRKDNDNCGKCGAKCAAGSLCTLAEAGTQASCEVQCTGGTKNCNGACKDLQSDKDNCGQCGAKCGASETCGATGCSLLPLGNGADGDFAPVADVVIKTTRSGRVVGTKGQKVIAVDSITGFAAEDLILIHQSQGSGAGKYEFATIANVAINKNITLYRDLANDYVSNISAKAQIVRVFQYKSVTIPANVNVSASAWDGLSGGIFAFKANAAVSILGTLQMSGRGFVGTGHEGLCSGNATPYRCNAVDTANGFSGESPLGGGTASNVKNGGGGGGGQDGQDCAAGGGGGHASAGTAGTNGSANGACRPGAQLGGEGGDAVGVPDLRTSLFFGSAGGEGGGDEDGAYPGAGGNGGGIIWIAGSTVTVAGSVAANGSFGAQGVQSSGNCGGSGAGMGGGGGGAGGAVRISAVTTATIGSGLVTANGGIGGFCSNGSSPGGTGGAGRVGIAAATVTGTSTPAFDPQ